MTGNGNRHGQGNGQGNGHADRVPLAHPPSHIGWLMSEAVHVTQSAVEDAVRTHGVTVAQSAVLHMLSQYPGLSGSELTRQMVRAGPATDLPLALSSQATHRAVATLERMGLIERSPDPGNARIARAVLTESGQRVAERCRTAWQALQQTVLASFDAGEREVLACLLERYVAALAAID